MKNPAVNANFYSEVLKLGAYAVLPVNLSDKWLDELTRQAQVIEEQFDSAKFPELLAAVLSILFAKSNYKELSMPRSELRNYLHLYSIELYAEKINRNTDFKIASATMETVLTDMSFHKTTAVAEALDKI